MINSALSATIADSGGQIEWLERELSEAEKLGQPVWLIGHVPPSYRDCNPKWALRYNTLVERYQHIVRFESYGHIHSEEFSVTRSLTTNKPISVSFIAGDAGTFDKTDPTFRLYEFHSHYHVPLEFVTFKTSISESNKQNRIVMDRWLDFKRQFGMPDLSPASHLTLSESFVARPEVALRYNEFKYKLDEGEGVCDQACSKRLYCQSFTSVLEHTILCLGTDLATFNEHFETLLLTKTTNPWVEPVKLI